MGEDLTTHCGSCLLSECGEGGGTLVMQITVTACSPRALGTAVAAFTPRQNELSCWLRDQEPPGTPGPFPSFHSPLPHLIHLASDTCLRLQEGFQPVP